MKKPTIQYGIIDSPEKTVLCNIEKGGDKNDTARYRFVDNGHRTENRHIALVSNETLLPDLYGALWARTKNGWVKTQDKITWYSSYREASNAYASLTNRKRKIILTVLLVILAALVTYLVYKICKNKINIPNVEPPINTDIDEISLD